MSEDHDAFGWEQLSEDELSEAQREARRIFYCPSDDFIYMDGCWVIKGLKRSDARRFQKELTKAIKKQQQADWKFLYDNMTELPESSARAVLHLSETETFEMLFENLKQLEIKKISAGLETEDKIILAGEIQGFNDFFYVEVTANVLRKGYGSYTFRWTEDTTIEGLRTK